MNRFRMSRRQFCAATAGVLAARAVRAEPDTFALRYILGSSMYGTLKLDVILPEVAKIGADSIDIWPAVHGDQREQIETIGHEAFAALLEKNNVKLGMLTHYDLGPFNLQEDMEFAKTFGASLMITGGSGPKGLEGEPLKEAVREFVEKMKPHVAAAEEHGLVIGVENHANNLIESPDSMRWLAEFAPSNHLGIAFAPYHLPQDPRLLAGLIGDLGPHLAHFYAWQHGKGCMEKRPKEQELLQMPGRGDLDFAPILAALKRIHYRGWTEIFMHPVPRGIPILPTAAEVTAEINRARDYLEKTLGHVQNGDNT